MGSARGSPWLVRLADRLGGSMPSPARRRGGIGAGLGAVLAALAAVLAAHRRGWAWLLAMYWLVVMALSLPLDGAAIARPTAWVAPAEAALLALAAGGAAIGARRIAAVILLLLFGGIHLSQAPRHHRAGPGLAADAVGRALCQRPGADRRRPVSSQAAHRAGRPGRWRRCILAGFR